MCVQKGETKIFYFVGTKMRNNFFVYIYGNAKQQRITPRYILSDWGTPPRQTQNYSQFKNLAQ